MDWKGIIETNMKNDDEIVENPNLINWEPEDTEEAESEGSKPIKNAPADIITQFQESLTRDFLKEWNQLDENHQLFFLTWMNNGFKASYAYQEVYKMANYHSAANAASKLLATDRMRKIRELLSAKLYEPLERCQAVEIECLDHPEAKIRLKAAKQIRDRVSALNPPFKQNPGLGARNVQINNYNIRMKQLTTILNSGAKGR
jgi:hypothetical protein